MNPRFHCPCVFVLIGFLLPIASFAALPSLPFQVQVEPIFGFESTQKLAPHAHATTRLMYGARATAGIKLVAAEAEYSRSSDTEAFPELALTTTDTADRLKLGLRSSIGLAGPLDLLLRAGGQATQNRHDETQGTEVFSTIQSVVIKPYVGTGLTLALTSAIGASLQVVAVFNNLNDLSQTEYQTTGGFSVKFP